MERLAIPLLMPVAVTAIVALIIAGIGSLLLAIAEEFSEMTAVWVALAIAGAVLIACALAARGGRPEPTVRH